jgi:transposase
MYASPLHPPADRSDQCDPGKLAELGVVAPVGRRGVDQLLAIVADPGDKRLPEVARICVAALGAQLQTLKLRILEFDRLIRAWHRSNEVSRRLDRIPGVGPALATALVASVPDPKVFRSGRDFSAWIGLVPSRTRAAARTGWATSANEATAICVVFSRPELSPSSATPRSTARDTDRGSRHFWRGDRPRSLPLRSPISSQGWLGQ